MPNLEVKIQKTKLAKSLEKTLNIKWELNQQFPYDAGFDLRACIDRALILLPTGHTTIPTGIHVEFSEPNWEMQVRPRSGLAAEHGITPGDRIAQACFREIPQVNFTYVDAVSETITIQDDTVKAASLADEMKRKLSLKRGGLGSTGSQ